MEIDHTGTIVEVTSYMLRMAYMAPKDRADESARLFKDVVAHDHDHLAVLFLASLMMQVGTIELLASRAGVPGLSTEALVTMMAQQALANDVA